jgi:prepilin-type N-terminal cleavage/methylation domain-containing protein
MRGIDLRRSRGFTLVELMITLIVLAVLVALAMPSMTETLDRRRLIGAAEAIYSQLQFARSEAIKGGRDMVVSYTAGTAWCSGMREAGTTCDCTETDPAVSDACAILGDGSTRVLKVEKASSFSGISIGTSAASIEFNNVRGTVDGGSGTVTLTSAANSRELRVVVSALGRIRMCSPTGTTNVAGYPAC